MWIIFLLWVFSAFAGEPLRIEQKNYLSMEDLAKKTNFHVFFDPKTNRLLFERKGAPQVIFLLDSPYALRGEQFLSLPESPIRKDNSIYLSQDSVERVFSPLLDKNQVLFAAKNQSLPSPVEKSKVEKMECKAIQKIFLDPGHGGNDQGTIKHGVKEKDIVLKFSRLAAEELRRRGFEVNFSRTKDVYLPLDIRSKLALEWKADIFISLHVNSSPHPVAHGTETYILSQEATDAEARRLALLENSIVHAAGSKQSAVQDILWDMEQTSFLQESAYLASFLQGALVSSAHDLLQKQKAGDWNNRGVRQAPFFVLNRAAMPAVLVELGYLSNERDRKLLSEKSFQERLAKALAEGVQKYKENCKSF